MIRSAWLIIMLCTRAITKTFLRGRLEPAWVDAQMQAWAKKILAIVELRYALFNPHQINFYDGKPYIIMLNHSSMYDIPLTLALIPASMRFITKKELFRIPLFGRACRCAGHIKVDRQNHKQAVADLEHAKAVLRNGISIWICPEGTRSRTGKLLPFKKGGFVLAIETGATIIPVGIRGAFDILPAKTFQFNLQQDASVHIGEPIDASAYTLDEKDALVDRVRTQIMALTHPHDA